MSYILRENLLIALSIAIEERKEREKQMGYTGPSGFLQGIQQTYDALNKGEHVEIV